ncbi:MAG: glycosyltransferase family 39 protein [Bryobacteraceae bacterium]
MTVLRMRRAALIRFLTYVVLGFLAATNVYRAATQSFTSGEWATHGQLVGSAGNTGHRAAAPDAWLSKAAVHVFGPSEFTLRLPAVAGGLLYFLAVLLLCRLLFGDSIWMLFALLLNVLNPYVLDSCSKAGGESFGLALWALGAYYLARWAADGARIPIGAAMALGMAAAFDLHQVFGAAALLVVIAVVGALSRLRTGGGREALGFLLRDALPFCVVSVVTATVLLWLPSYSLAPAFGGRGAPRYLDGVKDLTTAFLLYSPTHLASLDGVRGVLARLGWVPFAGLLASSCLAARSSGQGRADRLLALFSSAAVLTFLLLWLEPRFRHQPYFTADGLAFTQPLIFVVCPLFLAWLWAQGAAARPFVTLGTAAASLLLLNFALQFQLHSYRGWRFESATRRVVDTLEKRRAGEGRERILVAADQRLTPSLEIYRRLREVGWLSESVEGAQTCRADFFYLQDKQSDRLDSLGLREILRDRVAGAVLADIGPDARQRLAVLNGLGFVGEPQCNPGVRVTGSWVDSSQPGAVRHLLEDIQGPLEPVVWRWTFDRPAMLFHVPPHPGVRFKLEFVLLDQIFRALAPVELTVRMNGRELGRQRYHVLGNLSFERTVPPELLRDDGVALVETTLDKYWVSPGDGRKLGYMFFRGGFVY